MADLRSCSKYESSNELQDSESPGCQDDLTHLRLRMGKPTLTIFRLMVKKKHLSLEAKTKQFSPVLKLFSLSFIQMTVAFKWLAKVQIRISKSVERLRQRKKQKAEN